MTEIANADTTASVSPASATDAPVFNETPAEKMLRQSEVNELVGRVKNQAYEKGRAEILSQMGGMASQPQTQAPVNTMGGMLDEAALRRIMAEEAARVNQENANQIAAQGLVNDFYSKINSSEDKYPGLRESLDKMNLANNGHIVLMANGLDNTAAVMDELRKNPHKMVAINAVMREVGPELAMQEMHKLSNSIKENEKAAALPQANAPLSQLKSSPVGTSGSEMSISQLRRLPKYRG